MNQRANESGLTADQFEQLKTKYVDTIVDSMSYEDLIDYVKTDYYDGLDCYHSFNQSELFDDIKYTLDEEMLDEFITEIKGGLENEK